MESAGSGNDCSRSSGHSARCRNRGAARTNMLVRGGIDSIEAAQGPEPSREASLLAMHSVSMQKRWPRLHGR